MGNKKTKRGIAWKEVVETKIVEKPVVAFVRSFPKKGPYLSDYSSTRKAASWNTKTYMWLKRARPEAIYSSD